MTCTVNDLYKSVSHCAGSTILPGVRPFVFAIQKANIVKWPTRATTVAKAMGELVILTGSFTLAAEKKFIKIDLVDTKSSVDFSSQGEHPSKSFLNKGSFVIPGTGEDAEGFCAAANQDSLVYLIQDRDGKFRVIGNEMFDTNTKPEGKTGAGTTDQNETTISVEVNDSIPPAFYVGDIVTEDGTIDASTGLQKAAGA
jgi:hypothetical protein